MKSVNSLSIFCVRIITFVGLYFFFGHIALSLDLYLIGVVYLRVDILCTLASILHDSVFMTIITP